ncbi:MAG: hypothetical protein ACK4NC_04120 [Candidatus Gracilibacteria bacterium]
MEHQLRLIEHPWQKVLPMIKLAGENHYFNTNLLEDYQFWEDLGVFSRDNLGTLSPIGQALFETLFIRQDKREQEILKKQLLTYPPTIAIQQYLWGGVQKLQYLK